MEQGRFGVNPAHYMSANQMAWDAMLKRTGVPLDLIRDPALYLLIESGMCGGVCMKSKLHAKANNPQVGNFNPVQAPQQHRRLGCKQPVCVADVPFPPFNHFSCVAVEDWEKID